MDERLLIVISHAFLMLKPSKFYALDGVAAVAAVVDAGALVVVVRSEGYATPRRTRRRLPASRKRQMPERHQVDTVGAASTVTAQLPIVVVDDEANRRDPAQRCRRHILQNGMWPSLTVERVDRLVNAERHPIPLRRSTTETPEGVRLCGRSDSSSSKHCVSVAPIPLTVHGSFGPSTAVAALRTVAERRRADPARVADSPTGICPRHDGGLPATSDGGGLTHPKGYASFCPAARIPHGKNGASHLLFPRIPRHRPALGIAPIGQLTRNPISLRQGFFDVDEMHKLRKCLDGATHELRGRA